MNTSISAKNLHKGLQQGRYKLIDIRSPDERRKEQIPGSLSLPLDQMDEQNLENLIQRYEDQQFVLHCLSGIRTTENHATLQGRTDHPLYILEGGLNAWKAAGLDTTVNRKAPLPLQQQTHLAIGLLVLIACGLGFLYSPMFFLIAAFAGAGLTFAGLTGFCGMARLIALMPWNKITPG